MKVTVLGSGTSMGVPVIGCDCSVCQSECPKNRRTRSSLYVETEQSQFVIDTSPDFRYQMIRENIDGLDFVMLTHAHADHIMGLDDVRPLTGPERKPLDVYGKPSTLEEVRSRFHYLFRETPDDSWKPRVNLREFEGPETIAGTQVVPLEVDHGSRRIHGYRVHDMAYISDVSHIPQQTRDQLVELDLLFLDALRHSSHPTHFSLEEAVRVAGEVGAKRTYFTHLSHELEYGEVTKNLPEDLYLAYDGLHLTS